MKTQTDGPMKTSAVLELIRALPGARLEVPEEGPAHDRAILAFLGVKHLDKPQDTLVVDEEHGVDEPAEVAEYLDLIHGLVEDQRLFVSERVVLAGKVGVTREDFYNTYIVYTAVSVSNLPITEVELPSSIDTAQDLLAWIKWWGKITYRTRFERGKMGFLCEIAKACRTDASRTYELLDFVNELLEAKLIKEEIVPFKDTHKGTKGKQIHGLPAATHTLRAL